jgi:methylated-DNA-[protein]-cysteine S-methyltransferase
MNRKYFTYYESPLEQILLVSDGQVLTGLTFQTHRYREEIQPDWKRGDATLPFPQVRAQLAAYFAGELQTFDVPLALPGTSFQRLVWGNLPGIPYGSTI